MSIVLPHRGTRGTVYRSGSALIYQPVPAPYPVGPGGPYAKHFRQVGRVRSRTHPIPLGAAAPVVARRRAVLPGEQSKFAALGALGSGLEIADTFMTGPQPPILPLHVAATGDYNAVRNSPADGACGVHDYPCKHPGTDVGGVAGTVVHAPEDGTVTLLADGSSPPWRGYGPYLLLMLGKSGYYHLMAHLQPGSVLPAIGDPVTAGQAIAVTSSANHTHWEVRKKPTPNYAAGETNFDNNLDPVNDWLPMARGTNTKLFIVAAGLAVAAALYFRGRR